MSKPQSKKTKHPPLTTASLSPQQINQLAASLVQTKKNPFTVVEELFGAGDYGDELIDRLQSVSGIKKCEECELWLPLGEFESDEAGTCDACVDGPEEEGDLGDLDDEDIDEDD